MSDIEKIERKMEASPSGVRFQDFMKVCARYFGKPRVRGSHHVYELPAGVGTVVSVQEGKDGKAKPYQVKQVQQAIKNMKRKP